MYTIIRLEDDPVSWVVSDIQIQTLAHDLERSETPLTLHVAGPLQGRLVLNPRTVGSVALFEPPSTPGWIPSYVRVPAAHLYVPSATGPTSEFPGYALAPSTDLDALERDIAHAIHHRTVATVTINDGTANGVLALNGAALRLVVLCPPTRV